MRIIVPIHSFEPGGVERVALHLATAWQAEGAEVRIVLGRRDGAMRDLAPDLDYVVRPSPVPTAAWETIWMIFCLWRYLRGNPGGVIFASGNTYAIVAVAMKLLLGRQCPPILLKLSNDLERPDLPQPVRLLYHVWLRIQGRMIDRFVAMAPALVPEIIQHMGAAPDRVAVIEDPALAPGQFERLSAIDREQDDQPRHLLSIGRLAGQKNQALMIRALAMAKVGGGVETEADQFAGTLTICGEGAQRQRLEQLASQLGIADRVTFAGHCRNVTPYLTEASALVLSSDYEGLPAVVIEALAAGLPVIATDCSAWIHAILHDGRLGILVPRGDVSALSRSFSDVSKLKFDPSQAREVARSFTIAAAAPRYVHEFARIAACANASAR